MNDQELVPGKLRIVRRIGEGGMGVVYEALHLHLDRRVAVKVIHPLNVESPEARTRFLREARALAALTSEHIVQVLDVDTLAEGAPFMVMEYLEGRDLSRELQKRGPLPIGEAVGYVIQACSGVAAAHSAGIVHRDIKPANVFITNLNGARCVKILDFGVAKFERSPDQLLTGPTRQIGTPLYMAPEQLNGTEAEPRSDIWALGVVLYEILTGRSPFRRATSALTSSAVLNEPPPSMGEERPDLPLGLVQVVLRCLEKSPPDRFADASELAAALAPFGPRQPIVRASQRVERGSSAAPPRALTPLSLDRLAADVRSARQRGGPLSVPVFVLPDAPALIASANGRFMRPNSDSERLRANLVETVESLAPIRPGPPVPANSVEPASLASPLSLASPVKFRWLPAAVLVATLLTIAVAGKVGWSSMLASKRESASLARSRAASAMSNPLPSPASPLRPAAAEPEPSGTKPRPEVAGRHPLLRAGRAKEHSAPGSPLNAAGAPGLEASAGVAVPLHL